MHRLGVASLGIPALLVPCIGIPALVLTQILACASHVECSRRYPTISFAASFQPGSNLFAVGMCITAALVLVTVLLFCWHLWLRLPMATAREHATVCGCGVLGAVAALILSTFGLVDSSVYRQEHALLGALAIAAMHGVLVLAQAARQELVRQEKKPVSPLTASTAHTSTTVLIALRQLWQQGNATSAHAVGRICQQCSLSLSFPFAVLFLCVTGIWRNPLDFTFTQLAIFEDLALGCQLLYMATLSSELSLLSRDCTSDTMEPISINHLE